MGRTVVLLQRWTMTDWGRVRMCVTSAASHPCALVLLLVCKCTAPRPHAPNPWPPSLPVQDLFVTALDFAGTYGVLVLFGLIPVAMVR